MKVKEGLLVNKSWTYVDIPPGSNENKSVDNWGALPTLNKQTFVENITKNSTLVRSFFNLPSKKINKNFFKKKAFSTHLQVKQTPLRL